MIKKNKMQKQIQITYILKERLIFAQTCFPGNYSAI